MSNKSRTIQITLVGGTPTGVRIAELGVVGASQVVVASRESLPKLLKRDESARAGIYILTGSDPDHPSRTMVYVGQSEEVRSRLSRHDSDPKKEFFKRICVVVHRADDGLNSAQAKYLEARIIKAVRDAGQVALTNEQKPSANERLKEGEAGDMDRFFEELELLLPVVDFDILRKIAEEEDAVKFVLRRGGADATASVGSEFVVLKDSRADSDKRSISDSIRRRRQALVQDGILEEAGDNGGYVFTRDCPFETSSGAASILYGGGLNGRREWKLLGPNGEPTGNTYGDWRDKEMAGGSSSGDGTT